MGGRARRPFERAASQLSREQLVMVASVEGLCLERFALVLADAIGVGGHLELRHRIERAALL
jgi:hypothetical protein